MPIPSNVWLALSFEGGYTDQSSYAHAQTDTPAQISTGSPSRTADTYANTTGTLASLNYDADLNELNGLTALTIEFDVYVPNVNAYGYMLGPTGGVYTYVSSDGAGNASLTTYGWISGLHTQTIVFSAGALHHVAFVGGTSDCRIFVDGVSQYTSGTAMAALYFSLDVLPGTDLGIFNIASPPSTYQTIDGMRIDNLIITKAEKYTADFTPGTTFAEIVGDTGGGGGTGEDDGVRLLVQEGWLSNRATHSPWAISSSGISPSDVNLGTSPNCYLQARPSGYTLSTTDETGSHVATYEIAAHINAASMVYGTALISVANASFKAVSATEFGLFAKGISSPEWVFTVNLTGDVFFAITAEEDADSVTYTVRAATASSAVVTEVSPPIPRVYLGTSAGATSLLYADVRGGSVTDNPAVTKSASVTQYGYASGPSVPQIIAFEPTDTGLEVFTPGGAMTATATKGGTTHTYTHTSTAATTNQSALSSLAYGIAALIGGTVNSVYWGSFRMPVVVYPPSESGDAGWTITLGAHAPACSVVQRVAPSYAYTSGRPHITQYVFTLDPGAPTASGASVILGGAYSGGGGGAISTAGMTALVSAVNAFGQPYSATASASYNESTHTATITFTSSSFGGMYSPSADVIINRPYPAFDRFRALRVTMSDVYATESFAYPSFPLVDLGGNFSGEATISVSSTGMFEAFTAFAGDSVLDAVTSDGAFTSAFPAYMDGGVSILDDISSSGTMVLIEPAYLVGATFVDDIVSSGDMELVASNMLQLVATVPAATISARITQFFINAVVPAATMKARIVEQVGLSIDATVPSASLSAWAGMGLHGSVPAATITASATVVNTLRVDAQLPRVTIESALSVGRLLSLVATVPAATVSAWTGAQVIGNVPAASLSSSATTGGVFTLVATVPAATASIGASSVNVLRLSSDVPAVVRANWTALSKSVPVAGVLANVTPVVAITRVAYSFTLANSAMTRYPAYPFIQIIRMGNTFYGVAEDGLHEIGGTTDNATPIAWTWETCMSDFGQAEKKTPVSVYLGGYVPASMTYTIRSGDSASGTAAHATTATAVLRNHRQKLGLGRKSRFFAFGLAGSGQVSVESIEFEMATMSRRI